MPKRKSSTNLNKAAKKISLKNTTGIDGSLESMERSEKASQKDKCFADETPEFGNSSLAVNNNQSRLSSRLYFRFL